MTRTTDIDYLHVVAVVALLTWDLSARADLLLSFPTGTDPGWVDAVADEIEKTTGSAVVGIVAMDSTKSEASDEPPQATVEILQTAKTAYKELHLEEVTKTLDDAESLCLDDAEYDICRSFLFETNLLRGMALEALGKNGEASQAFRSAHIADHARVIDPRLYPPRISRAFAKACSSAPNLDTAVLTLSSTPEGAVFRLDGRVVGGRTAPLGPGRHIVESQFIGYKRQWRVVDVDAGGGRPVDLAFRLSPTSELEAWKILIERVSSPSWRPGEPGMSALMTRFKIEHVIRTEQTDKKVGGAHLETTMAAAGDDALTILPSLGRPGEPVSKTFMNALSRVLGLPSQKTPALVEAPSPPEPEDLDDADDMSLEEEEDPSIRFTEEEEDSPEDHPDDNGKLVKSPWLWISVAVVAAIVSGFVVTTRVSD